MEKNQGFESVFYIIEKIESLEARLQLAFDDYKRLKEYNIFFNTDNTEYVHEQVLSRKKQYIDTLVRDINVQRALVNLEPIYLHECNAEPIQNIKRLPTLIGPRDYTVVALDATKSKMTTAVLKDGDHYSGE